MSRAVELVCEACGHVAGSLAASPYPFVCPEAGSDGADHLLAPRLDAAGLAWPVGNHPSPFVRYRTLLFAHQAALELGLGDQGYLDVVRSLDAAVDGIDGVGFRTTPLVHQAALDALSGATTLVKDETSNVSGSHKARHLFGIALHLEIVRRAGLEPTPAPRLSIASCGNAALAAAVVAKAAARALDVHVPPDASPAVLDRLARLGASIHVHARRPGQLGDPCMTAFRDEVREGAVPFGCQGTDDGLTLDGGRTLAFEVVDQLRGFGEVDRVFVQVGGGALASALGRGLDEARRLGAIERLPRIHPVQSERVAPVRAAYGRLLDEMRARLSNGASSALGDSSGDQLADALRTGPILGAALGVFEAAARDRDLLFRAWADPKPSVAHGILDDDTYDGLSLLRSTVASGGSPVTVDEATLVEAAALMRDRAGIDVDETGAAGFAGLLQWSRTHGPLHGERVLVLATGHRR
jgi:threonine synthase